MNDVISQLTVHILVFFCLQILKNAYLNFFASFLYCIDTRERRIEADDEMEAISPEN